MWSALRSVSNSRLLTYLTPHGQIRCLRDSFAALVPSAHLSSQTIILPAYKAAAWPGRPGPFERPLPLSSAGPSDWLCRCMRRRCAWRRYSRSWGRCRLPLSFRIRRGRTPSFPVWRRHSRTYLKSRQGSRDAERPFYVRDSQWRRAGVCELELAGILRAQAHLAQIADSLFKTNLRQRIFRHHRRFR